MATDGRANEPIGNVGSTAAFLKNPRAVWEAVAVGLLLLWRLLTSPVAPWLDWVVILAIFWIHLVILGKSRAWNLLTAGAVALLLGIHFRSQVPHLLQVLGVHP
jgi:hypothetical protein